MAKVELYAFEGIIVGPQETNRPYPKDIFLPLKMNPENEIVREANLPPVIHIIVTGAGSIIPYNLNVARNLQRSSVRRSIQGS